MLPIDKNIIQENTDLVMCSLSYPVIRDQVKKDYTIELINTLMYEDITMFKEIVTEELNNSIFKLTDYKINAITEYKVTFNKNNIISIPIEFSQLIGLYDITYVNCYNFDLSIGKNLTLDDIFDEKTNYLELINKKLASKFDYIVRTYGDTCVKLEDEFKGIYNDQSFYIESDGIVITFSSYEMSESILQLIEFKLLFSNCVQYLSQYTINNIWDRHN